MDGRGGDLVKNKNRKSEQFGLTLVTYAEVGKRRVDILDIRENCGTIFTQDDPFKRSGVLYIKQSYRETGGVVVSIGLLPVKLHVPLLS
jgi:hypothetical protein